MLDADCIRSEMEKIPNLVLGTLHGFFRRWHHKLNSGLHRLFAFHLELSGGKTSRRYPSNHRLFPRPTTRSTNYLDGRQSSTPSTGPLLFWSIDGGATFCLGE